MNSTFDLSASPADGIRVERLASLFNDCTNSYKFLLFQTILDHVRETDFSEPTLPNLRILQGMVEHAWWPLFHYRLSFGNQDKTREAIQRRILPEEQVITHRKELVRLMRFDPDNERRVGLLRYVPSRLLSPWFINETGGQASDNEIKKASHQRFSDLKDPPLYRIFPDRIELQPAWLEYLKYSIGIIQPWADWHWLVWLQSRNPSVPEIAEKLGPPAGRRTLSSQKSLWQIAIEATPMSCIYSATRIEPEFALDHFIPRSFIGHDQLWNLVPMNVALNSAKGDRLPDRRFIDILSRVHSEAISIWERVNPSGWRTAKEHYALALRLEPKDLNDPRALAAAYRATISPLIDIATRMGFIGKWRPH